MLRLFMVLFYLLMSISHAASFDCSKASRPLDKTICQHAPLSQLDETMAQVYFELKNRLTGEPAEVLLNTQREWLKERSQSCNTTNASCLIGMYQERLEELKKRLQPPPPDDFATHKALVDQLLEVTAYYKRRPKLCQAILEHTYQHLYHQYELLTEVQQSFAKLTYISEGIEVTPFSVTQWQEHLFRFNASHGVIERKVKYIYQDVNNDGQVEYVQRGLDANKTSEGYDWMVIPDYNPQTDDNMPSRKHSKLFSFRFNNIDEFIYMMAILLKKPVKLFIMIFLSTRIPSMCC